MGNKKSQNNVLGSIIVCIALVVTALAVSGVIIATNYATGTVPGHADNRSNISQTDTLSTESVPEVSSQEEVSSVEEVSSEIEISSQEQTSSVSSRVDPIPVDPNGKVCYLTFDDGPSSNNTPKILDILDRYDIKATFFVVGTGDLSYLQRMKDSGHTIGLHANNHEYSKIYKSTDAYFNDLEALSDKVYEKVGIRSKIIRFPGGSSNTISRKHSKGIMTKLAGMVEDKGYRYFDWNVDSTDAEVNTKSAEKILSSVFKYSISSSGGTKGDICILMHDAYAKKYTVEALPEMIEKLKAAGYTFKALDQNSPGFHHGINN